MLRRLYSRVFKHVLFWDTKTGKFMLWHRSHVVETMEKNSVSKRLGMWRMIYE